MVLLRLFSGKIHRSADQRMGRHCLGQLHGKLHLRSTGLIQGIAIGVTNVLGDDGEGAGIGTHL